MDSRKLDAEGLDPIRAYQAQTDRMRALADFAMRAGPAFGETTGTLEDGRDLVDDVTPIALLSARNAAIQYALEAIGRLARASD